MEPEDCTWCGSARSIEYGVCQVCLMRFPEDRADDRIIVAMDPAGIEVEETATPEREAAAGD